MGPLILNPLAVGVGVGSGVLVGVGVDVGSGVGSGSISLIRPGDERPPVSLPKLSVAFKKTINASGVDPSNELSINVVTVHVDVLLLITNL